MTTTQSQTTYPVLCIPRAMLFHTAEFVESAFNQAMGGKFVKSVGQSTTTDKSGTQFNVFFIHPDQDFKATRSTDALYRTIQEQGTVNISTGSGRYFWKVKLYVPHLRAQYLPKPDETPVPVGPRIMTEADLAEFREFQRAKAAAKAEEERLIAEARIAEQIKADRQYYGCLLYPLVEKILAKEFPSVKKADKITGMLLEMSKEQMQKAIDEPAQLESDVREAVEVLRNYYLAEAGVA